jgi:hypothetical protein
MYCYQLINIAIMLNMDILPRCNSIHNGLTHLHTVLKVHTSHTISTHLAADPKVCFCCTEEVRVRGPGNVHA